MTPFGGDVMQLPADFELTTEVIEDTGSSIIDTHAYGTTSEVDSDVFDTVYPLGTFLQIDDETEALPLSWSCTVQQCYSAVSIHTRC